MNAIGYPALVVATTGARVDAAASTVQSEDFVLNEILVSTSAGELTLPDNLSPEQEQHFVELAKEDAEVFGQLYRYYVKRIYNYHYRHTGSPIEAEDLTSRTFYRALRSIRRYKYTGSSFQAWLFRIAHNLVVNWYRDQSRRPVVSLDATSSYAQRSFASLASHGPSRDEPHENIIKSERHALLWQLVDQLPEIRKTLLILKFVEKMSNQEIAKVLGKTEGAIKSLYHRTLLSLRESIEEGDLADGLS